MPGKLNYFLTTRLCLLSQSPQSPHGILGDVSQKIERTKSSSLWSRLVFQGAGSTSDVLVCNLNNLRAGHRWGGLSK